MPVIVGGGVSMARSSRNPRAGKIPDAVSELHRLRHQDFIFGFSWSPDGDAIVVSTGDSSWLWNVVATPLPTARKLPLQSIGTAFSPDGRRVALFDSSHVSVMNLATKKTHWERRSSHGVDSIAWSRTTNTVAVCDRTGDIELLDGANGSSRHKLTPLLGTLRHVAWSNNSDLLASASTGGALVTRGLRAEPVLRIATGHAAEHVAWAPDDQTLAVASGRSVILWSLFRGRHNATLEGHVKSVTGVSYSADGRLLASVGQDDVVCLWHARDGHLVGRIPGRGNVAGAWRHVAFHPRASLLATLDDQDKTIRLWRIDVDGLLGESRVPASTRYTTAKIALVGDGSVGKTSLGHRMIAGEFKSFPRSHGQQFWPYPAVSGQRADGTECEAILWDLAGQTDYRLTHALFVDDADVAIIIFNASDRQQPLKGVEYWLAALRRRHGTQCRTILVGAQLDTGALSLTGADIADFCLTHEITGGYIGTSAQTGQGVADLVASLARVIPWDELPATVTTSTFKRIKDVVLRLKSTGGSAAAPLEQAELRTLLLGFDPDLQFTDSELIAAAGHLEDHGYLSVLRMSEGGRRFLLAPDALINLAASTINAARANPRGLGALIEHDLLSGRIELPELSGLAEDDRGVLLNAAVALFLEHNVCFRERLGTDILLVFPALIHQVKPESEAAEMIDDVSFEITGATDRFYATLVVLLGYTNTFTRTNQWQRQAQYETAPDQVCGFRQLDESEGRLTLGLYYGSATAPHTRRLFEGLVETFLFGRDVGVVKYPAVACPACSYRQDRAAVVRRIRDGKPYMGCVDCFVRIDLPKVGELVLQPAEQRLVAEGRVVAQRRTEYETALTYVKGLVRDRMSGTRRVRCFVSYAWSDQDHERWVAGLVDDLARADVDVVFDQRDNAAIGRDVARFISDGIESSDFVAVVGTPLYLDKYINKTSSTGTIVAAEVDLIHQRLTGPQAGKDTVLPLLRSGERAEAFPPLLRGRTSADFRADDAYFASLLDLVLTLHAIAVTDPAVADLREKLRR